MPYEHMDPYPKAQDSPKAFYSMGFGPKALKYESLEH